MECCPICKAKRHAGRDTCSFCEFNFATSNAQPAIARIAKRVHRARWMWGGWLGLLVVSIAIAWEVPPEAGAILLVPLLALIAGAPFALVGLISGFGLKAQLARARNFRMLA